MITFGTNCKGMAVRREKCQVHAGRSSKFCKENLGQDHVKFFQDGTKVSARCKASIYIDALHLALTCMYMIFNKIKNLFF